MTLTVWIAVGALAVVLALTAVVWLGLRPAAPDRVARHRPAEPTRSPKVTMYSRVGVDAIRTVVEQFYRRVLYDPQVSVYFRDLTEDGITRLKRHQALLFGQLLGGPVHYSLDVLDTCHQRLRISPEAYAIVVGHLLAVLYGLDVPSDVIKHLCGALEDVRPLITVSSPHRAIPTLEGP